MEDERTIFKGRKFSALGSRINRSSRGKKDQLQATGLPLHSSVAIHLLQGFRLISA